MTWTRDPNQTPEQELFAFITRTEARLDALEARTEGFDNRRLGPTQESEQSLVERTRRAMGLDKASPPLSPRSPAAAPVPPVDRSATVLTDGSPVTSDHRELRADGQQKGYVVLSDAERAKGFVRPVRTSYIHDKCGAVTKMGIKLAETYARDPGFYSGTFCATCREHYPLTEFRWDDGTGAILGS